MMHFCFFQILIIAVVIVATFVIPISHLNQLHSGWIYTTLVGNCLFIILQMVCLIDSTGSICKNLDKIASRSRWWAFVEVSTYHHAKRLPKQCLCKRRLIDTYFVLRQLDLSKIPLLFQFPRKKLGQFEKNCISRASEKVIVTFFDHRPFWPYSSCRSG